MTLVSVIISTYNSSPFIIETLDSVLNQTWKDIELTITDDFSDDNTVELCREWLSYNRARFVNSQVLESPVNTGISSNANRGLYAAKGEWIKFLGADDTLTSDCLNDNMQWISSNPDIKVLFSRVNIYRDSFSPDTFLFSTEDDSNDPRSIMAPSRDANSQYKMLLTSDRLHYSPSFFIHRDTLLSVGGFDERIRFMEDYPLWLNLTRNGYRLYMMNKTTVNYRQHLKALYNSGEDNLIKLNYFRSETFRKLYTYPFLPRDIRLEQKFNWLALQIFRLKPFNRNTLFNRLIMALATIYLNPFHYYLWLRKRIVRSLICNEFYI